jgi:predicted ribonuclease YlaK
MLNLEVDQRLADLDEAVADLDRALAKWSRVARYVIPDTTVFINHPSKLRELDFASELQVPATPIHLVIPIAVVDELDRLKESKNQAVRWRAGHTLGVLDEVLRQSPGPGQLRDKDNSAPQAQNVPGGAVTVEIVLDPPGHVRLPIDDDEIIDRALAIKPLTPSPITLLTYDTGQATRAWAAGLDVVKLKKDIGPEPTTTVKVEQATRGRRRQRHEQDQEVT